MKTKKSCSNCVFFEKNDFGFPKTNCKLKSKQLMDETQQPQIDYDAIRQGRTALVHIQRGVSVGPDYLCEDHVTLPNTNLFL